MSATVNTLSTDILFNLYDQLAEAGIVRRGLRHHGLLLEAAVHPLTQENIAYDDLPRLAALYARAICQLRPFEFGNTKMAWHAAHLFLGMNDVKLHEDSYEGVIDRIAANATLDDLAAYIEEYCD